MTNIFNCVKESLAPRLPDVLKELLPQGKIQGHEYICASLQGGEGTSCSTNIETGKGSDFATGEAWGDIIALASKVWNVRQIEAAQELAKQYHINGSWNLQEKSYTKEFIPIIPIPNTADTIPKAHWQLGAPNQVWKYVDKQNQPLHYIARFNTPQGKTILPLCYGKIGNNSPSWHWKALPSPRPLYNLHKIAGLTSDTPILIVEGEKTADKAQELLPNYLVTTWSGGSQAVSKADWKVLRNRKVIIFPDNDEAGHKASLDIVKELQGITGSISVVALPHLLPLKWDLADEIPQDFDVSKAIQNALSTNDFMAYAYSRFPKLAPRVEIQDTAPSANANQEDLVLKAWPVFSWKACPGFLGDFVKLATRESEADPAAVCITTLVRFGAEVFAFGENKGAHIFVGETAHPPRLFAVVCGSSSKARKGTSRYPVATLFNRSYCDGLDLIDIALPAKESGGPLSTGEGLAYHVREETEEERAKQQKNNANYVLRERGDKRLIIQDEEFATALSCIKREGNTLSMGIRCFWDSGDYAPLTKNNPISVNGAHINIITHITMQELNLCLDEVQAVNGFGNRFLWICARRSKLVALPPRMPENEIAIMQRELWRLVGLAQKRGQMKMDSKALDLWKSVYLELSKEHTGFAGSIINRAEAQTLRLSLVYALLDGQNHINESHLESALALWNYAQASALYIFNDKGADPLEEKILLALKNGALSATELSAALQRHVSREKLQPILQQLEAQQKIKISKEKGAGRPRTILSLNSICEKRE